MYKKVFGGNPHDKQMWRIVNRLEKQGLIISQPLKTPFGALFYS